MVVEEELIFSLIHFPVGNDGFYGFGFQIIRAPLFN